MAKETDLKKYYKHLNLTKVKKVKNVQDELLYQIFKKPIEKDVPTIEPTFKNDTHQYDLLYLPNDDGHKYLLVGVDVGSRVCDAEPLKTKSSKAVLNALKNMYKRKILEKPYNKINVDSGSEFKGEFSKFFTDDGVDVVVALPNRHRQVALVETRNKAIGDYLLKRMVAQELKTGELSTEWIEWLPKLIKRLNKRYKVLNPGPIDSFDMTCSGKNCHLLDVGDSVRYALDRPIDVVTGKPIDSKFRSADVRYSLKPAKIVMIRFSSTNQPMYLLDGIHAYYTKDQLIPVKGLNLPPDTLQSKFNIEKIVGKKKIKGIIHFLVKWQNYDDKYNTWESKKHLIDQGMKHFIDDYERR